MFAVSAPIVPLVLLAPYALGSLASLVLLVHAARELVLLVLLAPDACGLLELLVLVVPAAGGSFTLVVRFQVICPSCPAMDSAFLLPSCLRFLIGVRFMVGQCCRVVVVVCICFLLLLLVVEECLAFGVRMLSGGIQRSSQ